MHERVAPARDLLVDYPGQREDDAGHHGVTGWFVVVGVGLVAGHHGVTGWFSSILVGSGFVVNRSWVSMVSRGATVSQHQAGHGSD